MRQNRSQAIRSRTNASTTSVAGMRRVEYVRMVEGAQVRFFAVGIGHRFPAEREISAAAAHELLQTVPCRHVWPRAAAGVPQ